MNKIIFLLAVCVSFLFVLPSCSKCYVCDFGSGDVRELCSKDNPNGLSGLKLTIDEYEKQGYSCTEK